MASESSQIPKQISVCELRWICDSELFCTKSNMFKKVFSVDMIMSVEWLKKNQLGGMKNQYGK